MKQRFVGLNQLFQMVLEDIKRQGIAIQGGTIIDASVIPSFTKPPMGGTVSLPDPGAGVGRKSLDTIPMAAKFISRAITKIVSLAMC